MKKLTSENTKNFLIVIVLALTAMLLCFKIADYFSKNSYKEASVWVQRDASTSVLHQGYIKISNNWIYLIPEKFFRLKKLTPLRSISNSL